MPGNLPERSPAGKIHSIWPGFAAACLILLSSPVFALRPFESTDADVVDAGETEIEFGLITLERDHGEDTYITPAVVYNYGLSDTLELVGEFELENAPQGGWKLVDPGLFLKAMFRQGYLQGQTGFSVATEAGALLPTGTDDADKIGGEGIVIISNSADALTYHVNLGGGINTAGDSFVLWGTIGEIPVTPALTLVGEINGEKAEGEKTQASILVGLLYAEPDSALQWDMGIRKGINGEAAGTTVTLGFTIAF